jgi:chromosome segregation ATPase
VDYQKQFRKIEAEIEKADKSLIELQVDIEETLASIKRLGQQLQQMEALADWLDFDMSAKIQEAKAQLEKQFNRERHILLETKVSRYRLQLQYEELEYRHKLV